MSGYSTNEIIALTPLTITIVLRDKKKRIRIQTTALMHIPKLVDTSDLPMKFKRGVYWPYKSM
jgi:hypothetical protein